MTESLDTLCFSCTQSEGNKQCKNCQRYFCSEHCSPVDPSICTECVNFSNTSIKSEPLVDSEGVTKQNARKITLSGESWMRQKKLICNMTDIELESYISAHQEAVHEMEIRADYFRIGLTEATHEKAERYNKKIRARSERAKLIGAVAKAHTSGQTLKDKTEDITNVMKSLSKMGLGKAQIAAILSNLLKNKPKG